MQNSFKTVFLLSVGMILASPALAQQPATTSSQPTTQNQTKSPAGATTKKVPATTKSAASPALNTQKEKASYALGMKIGTDLQRQGVTPTVDPALVARGLRDAMAGGKTLMTEDEARAALTQLRNDVEQKAEAHAQQAGAANRKTGEAFLAANKAKQGVVTLPSGLQYKILTEGNGPKPTATDTVSCNYRGTLIDGKEFDSSAKHGGPASFPVNRVIKGWTEALQLMPVGSKWQLFIPPDLAYGDRGAAPDIGPGETLIFEVELLSIGEPKK